MEIDLALRLGGLHGRRVQRVDVEFGAARQGNAVAADLDLGLRRGARSRTRRPR